MLMDFAYRYTSSVLSDAQALTAESGSGGTGKHAQEGSVSLGSLRQAIAARNHFHIQPQLPKEDLQDLSQDINRVILPKPDRDYGLRLPPEKYCLTGEGYGLKEEWDEEEEVEDEDEDEPTQDTVMKDVVAIEGGAADDEDIDQDEFEDAMGRDSSMHDA